MKSISFMKFDYDMTAKVDAILKKHHISFNYTNYIKKIERRYGNKQKDLFDDCSDNDWIDTNKFPLLKTKYKNILKEDEEPEIIELESGFIVAVYFLEKPDLTKLEDPDWDSMEIETLEDLDKALTLFYERLYEYKDLYQNPKYKDIIEKYKEVKHKEKIFKEESEKLKKKLEDQMNKIKTMEKDF